MPISSLHTGWHFHWAATDAWLPAGVPGCIHLDLQRENLIPNPFHGKNEIDLQWIGEREWSYRCSFDANAALLAEEKIDLVLEGLDTVVTVALNGEVILESDNMFHAHRLSVKEKLLHEGNLLEIRFGSALHYVNTRRSDFNPPKSFNDPAGTCGRIRKQPCQFGWDWGPRLITAGIWRPIYLEGWSELRIDSVHIAQQHQEGSVVLSFTPETIGSTAGSWRGRVSLRGKTIAEISDLKCEIFSPELWWPAGQGEQPLYEVTLEWVREGNVLASWSRRIGLRTITLDRNPDSFDVKSKAGDPLNRFGFRVNGRLTFAKGANWIPAHSFVHSLSRSDYEPLLRSAVEANMNLLRLWGGGIYEHEAFYDLCDELGLLLWHDFMFACDLTPSDEAFLASVRCEAEEAVRRIRHRACLALWCGNNELVMLNQEYLAPGTAYRQGYEILFEQLLPEIVAKVDGITRYISSSPNYALPEGKPVPSHDEHDWNVWHARFPVSHYETTRHRFVSEFGMQSYPSPEVASMFCPPEELNLFSPVFDNHQKNVGGNQVIFDYVSRLFRFPKDYRAAAYLSQLNQAWCMKVAVEHWRRLSPLCLGTVYWQLNDCWPVASWSSLEFGGKWKALHHEARRFFAPFLVSVRQLGKVDRIVGNYSRNDLGSIEIHAVQDTPFAWEGALHRRLCLLDGTLLEERILPVRLEPQHGLAIETADLTSQVEKAGRENVFLRVELRDAKGSLLAENTVFFELPRALKLERKPIRHGWQQVSAAEYKLTLSSDCFHYAVCLELENLSPRWSDNFFHLLPGEEKTIVVRFAKQTGIAALDNLQVFSLIDSF